MKNIIKEKRTEVNMNITMLSKLIGTSEETLMSWESGESEPSIPEIIRLSQIFNIKIDDFVEALANQKKNHIYDEIKTDNVINNESKVNLNKTKKEEQIIIFSLVLLFLALIVILSKGGSNIGSGNRLDVSEASQGERYALEKLSSITFKKPNVSELECKARSKESDGIIMVECTTSHDQLVSYYESNTIWFGYRMSADGMSYSYFSDKSKEKVLEIFRK